MSKSNVNEERRVLLKLTVAGVASVPLSSLVLQSSVQAGELPHLSEDDSTAKALSYVHDASASTSEKRKEGQLCKNCNLIQSTQGEWRPCSIFPGKAVNENGWCAAWVGRI